MAGRVGRTIGKYIYNKARKRVNIKWWIIVIIGLLVVGALVYLLLSKSAK